jgi:hypothetical protein
MKRPAARASAFAFLSILIAAVALADSMAGARGVPASAPRSYGEPPLRASARTATLVADLEGASAADIAALRHYNAAGNVPARVGLVHELEKPVAASRAVGASANEPLRWRGTVRVAGAVRLRLELTGLTANAAAKFWVYGATGAAYGFDASLAYEGTLWTPSVEGDSITVEIESPADDSPFTISSVANIRNAAEVVPADSSCIEDAKCYTGLDDLGTAVAHMQYVRGSNSYICTGGLIIESGKTFVPYFLTANHCISTPAEAASLETFWDFKAGSCGGTASLVGKPKVTGSTILVTSEDTDVTLLRLTGLPSGGSRYFLGWTSSLPAEGTTLYRVSHPLGQPLRYSTSTVTLAGGTCTGWPRPQFLYQTHAIGTTAGGSSGSPVVTSAGQIVGQLSGACGVDPSDPCNHSNRTVDGAFASSYALLRPYLNPGAPITPPCSACSPDANTSCMLNGRFKVTMTWRDPSANLSGNGRLINYSENRPITDPANGEISQVTFWSMYPNDTTSVEALVRMIRGGSSFWIFTTGFAAAEYTVTVQDTKNCTTWQRTSPFGGKEKIVDYNALPF